MVKALGCLLMCACLSACATTQETQRRQTELPAQTPEVNRGQAIAHAEMAADLAEISLTQLGVDCRDKDRRVSFMEGTYEVTYFQGDPAREPSWTVVLDAQTSQVKRVFRTDPKSP